MSVVVCCWICALRCLLLGVSVFSMICRFVVFPFLLFLLLVAGSLCVVDNLLSVVYCFCLLLVFFSVVVCGVRLLFVVCYLLFVGCCVKVGVCWLSGVV